MRTWWRFVRRLRITLFLGQQGGDVDVGVALQRARPEFRLGLFDLDAKQSALHGPDASTGDAPQPATYKLLAASHGNLDSTVWPNAAADIACRAAGRQRHRDRQLSLRLHKLVPHFATRPASPAHGAANVNAKPP